MTKILKKKQTSTREQTRAPILDLLRRAEHPNSIAKLLTVSIATVYNIQKHYLAEGLSMELSALSRQCLSRRIADIETLCHELKSIVKERNKLAVNFKWQFTVENAREKLSLHYDKVTLKTLVT